MDVYLIININFENKTCTEYCKNRQKANQDIKNINQNNDENDTDNLDIVMGITVTNIFQN